MRLGVQSVRILRAGASTEDEYHNEIPGSPTAHDVAGCSVQPGPGPEYLLDRSATTTVWTVWAPLDADVTDDDSVEYPVGSGKVYEIDGSVERWEVGDALDHLMIRLRKAQG